MRPAVLPALLCLAACSHPPRRAGDCDGPCPASKVDHLVVVVQENHTFDNYFARYCTAPAGSDPTCTDGPSCCEAGPDTEPSGASPIVLDDQSNGAYDPDHSQACELAEADDGTMDAYVTGTDCSDPRNFAYAGASTMQPYWDLATAGALADRYFQPIAGKSNSNDMYLARAQYVFTDNEFTPDAIGAQCITVRNPKSFDGPTLGDLLDDAGVSWTFYAEGYQAMVDARAQGTCPPPPPDCAFGYSVYPCVYDPGDVPTNYYANLADDPRVLRDQGQLARDLAAGTLPQVVFVRPLGYRTEHPGAGDTLSDGMAFVQGLLAKIDASAYAPDTLVLLTWDEGGGYFDHVPPPGDGSDGRPYGTRVPLLAIGPFARAGTVSHVILEHSSIVKFVEWNWLGQQTGQLGGRDAEVSNLGSLLDPTATGTMVPE